MVMCFAIPLGETADGVWRILTEWLLSAGLRPATGVSGLAMKSYIGHDLLRFSPPIFRLLNVSEGL